MARQTPSSPTIRRTAPASPPDAQPRDQADLWTLLALLVVGLLARAPRLGESLWYDEIAAWREYGMLGPKRILTEFFDPSNHIAHTFLTWISVNLFSGYAGQELALRLPALLFSMLSVVAVYGLAAHVAGKRAAILAAILAAAAPVAVLEGVEARGYSMMIFFSAAATWQWMVALERPSRWRWIVYALLCAVGTWAHMMTAFVAVGHALWLAGRAVRLRDWRPIAPGGLAIVGAGTAAVALYAPVLADLLRIRSTFSGESGPTPSPFGVEGAHAILQLGGSWAWWAALPGLALFGLGIFSIRSDERRQRVVLLSLLGLPALVVVVTATSSWMYARFALIALPGAILLMALGLDAIWQRARAAGIAALVVLLAAWAGDLVARPPKQPLREAAGFVERTRTAGQRVLVIGLRHQVIDVYGAGLDPVHSSYLGRDLADDLDVHRPAWVIMLYPRSVDASKHDLLTARGFEVERVFAGWADWGNGEVQVWQRR